MLFGSQKDFNVLSTHISREILKDIVEQEVGYYKLSLTDTQANLYGEAVDKVYLDPVKLNCLITRGDQVITVDDFGPDLGREASFAFVRQDLVDANTVPEVGDIVMWHEDYYEVDTVRENQLFVGRDSSYNLTNYGHRFGSSVSIIVDCHLTRTEKVGIVRAR
jgi:hypothetical protein|tara:strand:- start:5247 stop:5735 length:489 start_codon:yes stop_codon:yes gene_type:complete